MARNSPENKVATSFPNDTLRVANSGWDFPMPLFISFKKKLYLDRLKALQYNLTPPTQISATFAFTYTTDLYHFISQFDVPLKIEGPEIGSSANRRWVICPKKEGRQQTISTKRSKNHKESWLANNERDKNASIMNCYTWGLQKSNICPLVLIISPFGGDSTKW